MEHKKHKEATYLPKNELFSKQKLTTARLLNRKNQIKRSIKTMLTDDLKSVTFENKQQQKGTPLQIYCQWSLLKTYNFNLAIHSIAYLYLSSL